MKKIILASMAALLAYSLFFSVQTASAALAVDQTTTPWTWTADQGDTFRIWDSGDSSPQWGTDISGTEEFGIYNLVTSEKLRLLNGSIDMGTLGIGHDNDNWFAIFTIAGESNSSSLTLNSYTEGSLAEWGFYAKNDNSLQTGTFGLVIGTDLNEFEIQPDGMRATISAVPIPGAGLLLTTGLIGLAGIRTRFGKK